MTCIHILEIKNLISNYRSEPFIDSSLIDSSGGINLTGYNPCPDCDRRGNYSDGVKEAGLIECYKMGCWYRKKILEILNECNCENSQLAVVRNTETSLIRVQNENYGLSREVSRLQGQLEQKDRDIEWGKGQLELAQRGERAKQNEVNELTCQLAALQIENNRNKDKIKDLKGELGQSKEEYLNQKIGIKQEKLETLAQQLGINQGQINNLLNAYRQLIEARENFNQANINAANANINNLRAGLATTPTNRQKFCRKCEKLVKLEIELNKVYQQQFEARQEVPPR